jgi:putative Holliday junction resolvase
MRVLGIDFGARRIGLALSDATGTLATPWRMVTPRASPEETAREIGVEVERLAAGEDGLAAIVIGWPRRLDGSANEQTGRVEAFMRALASRVNVPVVLQDERLSSHEADARLAVRERDWRRRKARLDAAAAAVILQDYLDAQPPLQTP